MGVLLRRSLLRVALAAVISTLSGAAIATTCADYATTTQLTGASGFFGQSTIPIIGNFATGDALTLSISWNRTSAAAGTATLDFQNASNSQSIAARTVGVSGTSGGPVSFASITLAANFNDVVAIVEVPNTSTTQSASLFLQCTSAPVVGGGGGGGGGGSTPSATIQSIQQSQTQIVGTRSIGMIGGMVRSSIDSAFVGGSDTEIMAMGYAGSLVLDATPEEMLGSGVSLWTGARYELALAGTGQWGGGQAGVAGGLNYRIDESWIAGVFATYEAAGYRLNGSSDTLGSSGFGLGLTTAYRLDEAWRVELIGSLSRLNYAISSGATTASLDATRLHIDAGLAGTIPVAATIDFLPRVGVSMTREEQAAYTDSASVAHAAASLFTAEAMAGGKFLFYPLGEGVTFSLGGGGRLGTAAGLSANLDAGAMFELAPNARLAIDAGLNGLAANRPITVALQAKLSGDL